MDGKSSVVKFHYFSLLGIFLATFVLSGCGLTGTKQKIHLVENHLIVPLTKPESNTWGSHYGLYRVQNLHDKTLSYSVAQIPNLGFFTKPNDQVYLDRYPVAVARENTGTVAFDLPLQNVSPTDCFVVVNMPASAASSYSKYFVGFAIPLPTIKSDSNYLIGLEAFSALVELTKAKENLIAAKSRIEQAQITLANSRAYMHGKCVRREILDPPKSSDFLWPDEAELKANQIAIDWLWRKIGCDFALHGLVGKGKPLAKWERYTRGLACGTTDLTTMDVTEIADHVFSHCAMLSAGCLLGYGLTTTIRFEELTERITMKLSQPYLRWKHEADSLKQAEFNEYSVCSNMLGTWSSSDRTLSSMNQTITTWEQNLRLKANKNSEGLYVFDVATLVCSGALSNYILEGK